MRVYKFTKTEHGLAALRDQRLKVARIHELNDPFEFLGVDLSDRDFRRAITQTKQELSKTAGLLCFSKSWRHPLLWSHYADNHRGICLGLDINDSMVEHVSYVNSRFPKPDVTEYEALVRKLLFTKFAHWSYEDEYRVYVDLKEEEDGLFFFCFSENLALKEVIIGHECKLSRSEIGEALGELRETVTSFKARPAFRSFRMVKQKNERMWA
jgi:hypothetical protein